MKSKSKGKMRIPWGWATWRGEEYVVIQSADKQRRFRIGEQFYIGSPLLKVVRVIGPIVYAEKA